jgi:hypothetical protein
MRSRPDLAPGGAGDEFLKFGIQRRLLGVGAVDPDIAQHLAALRHAFFVTFFLVHRCRPLTLYLRMI